MDSRYNVRRDTRRTLYEKIRGQKTEIRFFNWENKSSLAVQEQMSMLLQPWLTGLWLGRDTLSDEHLIGTAEQYAVSKTARWVPAALNAVLFTPWSPQLNLPAALVCRDQQMKSLLKPERYLDSLTFPQHQPPRIRSQKRS